MCGLYGRADAQASCNCFQIGEGVDKSILLLSFAQQKHIGLALTDGK
jgi:hypothetical protein